MLAFGASDLCSFYGKGAAQATGSLTHFLLQQTVEQASCHPQRLSSFHFVRMLQRPAPLCLTQKLAPFRKRYRHQSSCHLHILSDESSPCSLFCSSAQQPTMPLLVKPTCWLCHFALIPSVKSRAAMQSA